MSEREVRAAQNESLFREFNERIRVAAGRAHGNPRCSSANAGILIAPSR